MEKILQNKKFKHTFFIAFIVIMILWCVFRFAAVASENARYVFNASRVALESGLPIESVVVTTQRGTLYEPLAVRDNRAYVTGERAHMLRAGQRVGDGKIVSVSTNLDLNTGMHLVRTSGVSNGLQFAEFTTSGHFIPLYAISGDTVYVVENVVATARTVKIARQDAERAYIKSGLNDGDVVILSKVKSGEKVKVNK